jgi:hypothetical protein
LLSDTAGAVVEKLGSIAAWALTETGQKRLNKKKKNSIPINKTDTAAQNPESRFTPPPTPLYIGWIHYIFLCNKVSMNQIITGKILNMPDID